MLKLNWIEIFLRLIPEMLIIIWGVHLICKQPISIKKYLISSIVMGVVTFIIRCLPIYFGVHMFIVITLTICAMVIIGIQMVNAIYGTLLMFTILTFSELINIVILMLLNLDVNNRFQSPVIKSVFGIPSFIIMYILTKAYYCFIKRREGLKNVDNGEDSD